MTAAEASPAATPAEVQRAGVQYVDPSTLTMDTNIRTNARLDPAFLASVRSMGVLVPIHVRLDPFGHLLIIDGQRRTLAALETWHATVPVIVVDGIGDEQSRILNQWHLNEYRTSLTATERADAVGQMALFGRSAAAIARELAAPREEVEAALAVSGAPATRGLMDAEPALDLVTAAKLAEFEDDPRLPELAAAAVSDPARVDHLLALARQDRAVDQTIADVRKNLAADGARVLDEPAGKTLGRLGLAAAEHTGCPHRAVLVRGHWEDDAVRVTRDERCLDPVAAGHPDPFTPSSSAAATTAAASRPPDGDAAAGDEEETEAPGRAYTIAQNKASDAAREVRTRFIRDLTGRLRLPDGAVQHAVLVLESVPVQFTGWGANDQLRAWDEHHLFDRAMRSPREATLVLLLRALATGEHLLARDFWRTPARYSLDARPEVRVLHLQALARWGYTYSEIEADWLAGFAAPNSEDHDD